MRITSELNLNNIAASHVQEKDWSLLSFTGKMVEELLDKFDGEFARIHRVDFLETVMKMARLGFPGDRRYLLENEIIIGVVTGEPVLVGHSYRSVLSQAIFAHNELTPWETQVNYTLRSSAALSAALQEHLKIHDILIISGGYTYSSNVMKTTFLDLTAPELKDPVRILRLTNSLVSAMETAHLGFAQIDDDADDYYPLPQRETLGRLDVGKNAFLCHSDEFDHNNNTGSPNPWGTRDGSWKGDYNGPSWFFVVILVVVALLSFSAG